MNRKTASNPRWPFLFASTIDDQFAKIDDDPPALPHPGDGHAHRLVRRHLSLRGSEATRSDLTEPCRSALRCDLQSLDRCGNCAIDRLLRLLPHRALLGRFDLCV